MTSCWHRIRLKRLKENALSNFLRLLVIPGIALDLQYHTKQVSALSLIINHVIGSDRSN